MTRQQAIERLLSAWNINFAFDRAAVLASTVNDSFYYCDPHQQTPIIGAEQFAEFLSIYRDRVPNATMALEGLVQSHQSHAYFRFQVQREKAKFASGCYFADFDADGRIKRMVGFLD